MATKLFVGNLPHSATDVSLGEFVTNAGFQVASAVVVRDKITGNPRGFGFVEMDSDASEDKAIQALDGAEWMNREMKVNKARPRENRNSFSGNRNNRF